MTVVFPKLLLHSFIAFTKIILYLLKSFFFFFREKLGFKPATYQMRGSGTSKTSESLFFLLKMVPSHLLSQLNPSKIEPGS